MFLNRLSSSSLYSCNVIYSNLKRTYSGNYHLRSCFGTLCSKVPQISETKATFLYNRYQCTNYCSAGDLKKLSSKEKLKLAVRDYGATIVVFHVAISLASLGCCYVAIYSGVNITDWLEKMNLHSSQQMANVTGGVSTFVIAYAVHKVFAPVRIGITLSAAPILVRYLRRIGVLKPRKP